MHLSFDFLDPVPEYQKIADLEADVQFLKQRVEQLEEEKTEVLQVQRDRKYVIYRGEKALFKG